MPLKKNIQCCQPVSFSLWPWAANMTPVFLASLLYFSSQFTLPLSRMTVPTLSPISLAAFFFLIRWLCPWSLIRTELPHPPISTSTQLPVSVPTDLLLTGCKWKVPAGLLPEARVPMPALDSVYIPSQPPRGFAPASPFPLQLPKFFPLAAPHADISHY